MTEIGVSSIGAYAAQSDYSKNTKNKTMKDTTSAAGTTDTSKAKQTNGTTGNYGRTIGQPELSEKAAKYYEQLKKKYGNYDFILVSRDQKENAKANAQNMPTAIRRLFSLMRTRLSRWRRMRSSGSSMRES